MTADILRERFLNFFKARKHRIVESDSLVPKDDPTVLFTPAGMNQFKKEFLGVISDFRRAATAQRCLRTDDLDKVGKTSGHHTFFEMLGNFSFGDYFKKEAITWAWEFLTDELKIDKERLWVSVYKDDDQALKIWRDLVKVPSKKIIKLGDKENFWPSEAKAKGPNGPCGPCSEIFFDWGADAGCQKPHCDPSCNCGRFVEVWNLVFTQYNRKEGGRLEPLPDKNIDTGMGLERLAAVIQGVRNNFETDLFQPMIKEIEAMAVRSPNEPANVYPVADHLRAIAFAVYDGILPSNEERGYVIRKLIRKSMLHLQSLGIKKPFLYKLVPVLAQIMRKPYPELERQQEDIAGIILAEEKNTLSTWNSSDILLGEKFKGFDKDSNPEIAGKIVFQLYDTYGLPLESTLAWLNQRGINFSKASFDRELEKQKMRSKAQSAMKGDVFSLKNLHLGIKETKFSGYKADECRAKILKILKHGKEVKKASSGEEVTIILDQSVFYPESGGQVGDSGEFIKGKNIFAVADTKKAEKVILHTGRAKQGSFKKNDIVSVKIDYQRRMNIARHHTATHLLQAALRKVLGPHVRQQGSLVMPERLRFDFTHFKDISDEELARIEELVNSYILDNFPLEKKQMNLAQAKKTGALAFFAEKYADKVRVVSIGDFSRELCAGTHLETTAQIGLFKITQEGSVASGVRRIEAVTGIFAYRKIKEEEEKLLRELQKKEKEIKEMDKQLGTQKAGLMQDALSSLLSNKDTEAVVAGITLIAAARDNLEMQALRRAVDSVREKNNTIMALGSNNQGRALLVVGVSSDLTAKGFDAARLILEPAKALGGSGGGRKDFAQAGGNKPENLPEAFRRLKEGIQNLP
ncbi:MAG: alanine--tRNA ligase [Candidatus Omnitrophota bacterium]|jgi:alanyl-tRNA synthetase